MSILNAIGGLLGGGVASVGKIFFGSKQERDAAAHEENVAGMQQYAAEFGYRENRNAFDSLVDGINRLMRPSMWFSTIGLFWMAPLDPDKFAKTTAALALIPEGMWYTLMIMVTFLFPSRLLEKLPAMSMSKGFSVKDARERLEILEEIQQYDGTEEDMEGLKDLNNPSIEAWKRLNQKR